MTQEELGKKVGVSRETINEIERGRRKHTNNALFQTLAEKTDTPVQYFYQGPVHEREGPSPDSIPGVKEPNVDEINISPELREALFRVATLPEVHQRRIGKFIEQMVAWFEEDTDI